MISPLGVESQTPHVADFGAHRDCNCATRAHFRPRTVFAASATAFSAAFAKLSLEVPTTSIIFCATTVLLYFPTVDCTAGLLGDRSAPPTLLVSIMPSPVHRT